MKLQNQSLQLCILALLRKSDTDRVVSNSTYLDVNLTKLFEGLFPEKLTQ